MFREVTPVGHNNLTGRITESGVGKRSHAGLILLNVIDSSNKGYNVLPGDPKKYSCLTNH